MRTLICFCRPFRVWLYSMVVFFLIAPAGRSTAQTTAEYKAFYSSGGSLAGHNYDQAFIHGMEALLAGDSDQAAQHFQAAADEAFNRKEKDARKRAQDAEKRVNKFYGPYLSLVNEAAALQSAGDFRVAQENLESARALAAGFVQKEQADFAAVDRELSARLDRQLALVDRQRLEAFNNHFRIGEHRLFGRDYAGALQELETARAMLFEEREPAQLDRLQQVSKQASYQQAVANAEEAMAREDYKSAFTSLKIAQGYVDSYDLQQKIGTVSKQVHYQLLKEAQQHYYKGEYEEATAKLRAAKEYGESEYLSKLETSFNLTSGDPGEASLEDAEYGLPAASGDGASSAGQVKKKLSNDESYAKAMELIEEGYLKAAKRNLREVSSKYDAPEVDELIRKIDAYYLHLSQGKHELKNDNSKAARQLFLEAEKLFPTDEIRKYLAETENK